MAIIEVAGLCERQTQVLVFQGTSDISFVSFVSFCSKISLRMAPLTTENYSRSPGDQIKFDGLCRLRMRDSL